MPFGLQHLNPRSATAIHEMIYLLGYTVQTPQPIEGSELDTLELGKPITGYIELERAASDWLPKNWKEKELLGV